MDDGSPFITEPLSYAEDIPYEAQLSEPTEQERTGSLGKRIGQRIYLLEDSMTKKRKLVDAEDNAEEEVAEGDSDLPYRSNAILLQGPPITELPTASIFAYATHFDARPIGLEWVDDKTCVLVFVSRSTALHAWGALGRAPQLVNTVPDDMEVTTDVDEAFHPAQSFPLALYPIEDRINTVLGNQKSNALKETIRMRWARTTDVKERSARLKSQFYKRHGEQAGKEGLPAFPGSNKHYQVLTGNKRRKRNDEETRRQLDAELDHFLEEDESVSKPLNLPPSRIQDNKDKTSESRSQLQEEKRRILDYELDSFLAQGDAAAAAAENDPEGKTASQGRSLLERTAEAGMSTDSRSPRARRRRNGRSYQTDADGRWLHNAEIAGRRDRIDYDDEGGFGMRAWSYDAQSKGRKEEPDEDFD